LSITLYDLKPGDLLKQSNILKTLTFTQNVFPNPLATFCRFEIVTKVIVKNEKCKKKAKNI